MTIGLSPLLTLVEEMPAYRQLIDRLQRPQSAVRAVVIESAKPYLLAALHRDLQQPMLVVTARPERVSRLGEQVLAWDNSCPAKLLPEPDALPYQRISTDVATEIERLRALFALTRADDSGDCPLVITTAAAVMGKMPSHRDFTAVCHTIHQGMEVEPRRLLGRWQSMGYRRVSVVEVPGTMCQRGGIVDIFPPNVEMPVRLEFFGNTVDSIRQFDPATQRSLTAVPAVVIGPASEFMVSPLDTLRLESLLDEIDLESCSPEWGQQLRQDLDRLGDGQRPGDIRFYASLFNRDHILSYLPPEGLLVLDEPEAMAAAAQTFADEAAQLRAERQERGELPADFPAPYFHWAEVESWWGGQQRLILDIFGAGGDEPRYQMAFVPAASYTGQLPRFLREMKQLQPRRQRGIIVSHQADRLSELLGQEDIIAVPVTEVAGPPPPGSLTLVRGSLSGGWVMQGDIHVFTDAEIFGFVKQRRQTKPRPVPRHKLFTELVPGDYVVHVEHGIARFAGVTHMGSDGSQKEYLVLRYAADDRLYVPTDQIDRVNRYVGGGERPPVLHRLGTQEWSRTKQRVKESVVTVARELLTLYASREVAPGFTFAPDTVWQQELEAAFPYVETPDQMAVQYQVKQDMERAKPMDRLVCGDVGYGKTEVAIRAAFKAVMDNKQVAVLVPTTVLAQQHLATFSQRLGVFPIQVEVLSRFRSLREQRGTIAGLADGTVDVCIGTHHLLQPDVTFKNLGLLIIDEEQRFGVAHKEYLKQKRQEVDVLTLSATPIPRTLHMSLVGVRDLSTMETPPEERLPIKTYVAQYDDRLVREAILRELERNGQVFLVHNRVQTIDITAQKLRSLVPEAVVAVAHGQMAEGDLERVMADFAAGGSDVLVCTTIIESGLDMPNVNTLIVDRANRFGLTQLYQLRGRVGRGANLAHAYFLYSPGRQLTETAVKRLQTIFEATELGAGFNIALKDLEIRGAGTLLGVKQSGNITAVGLSLYSQLMADAVTALKAVRAEEVAPPPTPSAPTIDLPLPAYIPEHYIADLDTRLSLYRRLAAITDIEAVDSLAREFIDRFGRLPPELENLIYTVRIKLLAARAGIESVATEEGQIVLRRFQGRSFDRQQLESFIRQGIKVGARQIRLDCPRRHGGWQRMLEELLVTLGDIMTSNH